LLDFRPIFGRIPMNYEQCYRSSFWSIFPPVCFLQIVPFYRSIFGFWLVSVRFSHLHEFILQQFDRLDFRFRKRIVRLTVGRFAAENAMIIFQFIVFIRSQLFSDIVLDYFGLISDEFIA